ncbi:riboflavin synthase [Arhodomonas aquaeolei]|uniref:riboflavin synthase n=3 Tax=Ectothiorhodospiraceae TaxID=72276 RepID=UPI0003672180|nr:riboflavin synthase [Arhodomonas aquaeolei]MCS4503379.1 riboflavin synthase [Arhodomonas aquaeolei]
MFTGIVQCLGRVGGQTAVDGGRRLTIEAPELGLAEVGIGDSIAVNGCCLTAVRIDGPRFEADVSSESLERTTLGGLRTGDPVNLEKALTLATPLGGHLVSGHVDGLGEVVWRRPEGRSERWRFRAPERLARYIAEKGSICIDGVSLTVNAVAGAEFELNLVPHTTAVTTLGGRAAGDTVNLEVDIIARYLERLMSGGGADGDGGITRAFLARHGFGG